MKRLLTIAVALATLALPTAARARVPAGSAHLITAADPGGCRFDGTLDAASATANVVLQGEVVSTLPLQAAWCRIRVNTAVYDTLQMFVSGQVGLLLPQTYPILGVHDTDVISVCTLVRISGTTVESCTAATVTQVPPQALLDALDTLFLNVVDPLLCPILQLVAPINISNVVEVRDPDGDVYLQGGLLYDCPPYSP